MRIILLTSILLALSVLIQAQTAVFNISPGGGFVRVGDTVMDLSKSRTLELSPGTYEAEIWVPRFEMIRREVVIEAGRSTVINMAMKKLAADYNDFQDERSRYNTDKLKRTLSGVSLIAADIGLAYFMLVDQYRKGVKLENRIVELQNLYDENTAFIGFRSIQNEYANVIEEHRKVKDAHDNRKKIGIPLVAVATAATAYLFYRRSVDKKVPKPKYKTDNPFVSILRTTQPYYVITETQNSLGFTLKF